MSVKDNCHSKHGEGTPNFPIFNNKKADINFTSSKTQVFAATAKDKLNHDVRPPPPRKKPAKAPKKMKISTPQGNTLLKYFTHLPGDELKQENTRSFHPKPPDC